jgi:hypothetical protein
VSDGTGAGRGVRQSLGERERVGVCYRATQQPWTRSVSLNELEASELSESLSTRRAVGVSLPIPR